MKYAFILLLALSMAALAQRAGWDFGGEFRGLRGGKVVTGEPYSASALTTHTETLSNGNVIHQSSCAMLYRDSQGRTRREETRDSATCSSTPQSIVISDPVAGVGYMINTAKSTYRQFTVKAPAAASSTEAHTRPANPDVVRTSLGTQAVPGTSLSAQGTQTVDTIPAGRLGNAQPITVTSVRWYSPDLQIVTQATNTDPRRGTMTYQLSNISTAEPAESLFQLPSGLTLQQGPAGRGRRAP
jgi:hypothetical protein